MDSHTGQVEEAPGGQDQDGHRGDGEHQGEGGGCGLARGDRVPLKFLLLIIRFYAQSSRKKEYGMCKEPSLRPWSWPQTLEVTL